MHLKMLIFNLGNKVFAADINDVERIIKYERATFIPDVPNFVEGVISHDGKVIPSINLNLKLGFEEKNIESKKIIIMRRKEKKFAIVVDNVCEVKDVESNLLEKIPFESLNIKRDYINGLINLNNKIIILLNLEKILTLTEEQMIF
ncbi:MAG: chemotaxis protein CheW [Clostridium sp.]|uniref:chemotaxis protein CheW n=1 Tax=Clostridium sp. TaxID=1506 RepID=UPI003F325220